MYCSRRLYKGNSYEFCLPLADTGVTEVYFYTDGEFKVGKEPVICGDTMCFALAAEDIEAMKDGVLRYTDNGDLDTNTPYVVVTPEGYGAKTLDEIMEEAYQSGYTDGYASGITECNRDYSAEYFTIEALENGDLAIRKTGVSYSINDADWLTTTANSTTIAVNSGDKIRMRGNLSDSDKMLSGNTLSSKVYGNIQSLYFGDDFSGETTCKTAQIMFYLYSGLTDASNLVLPATTLANYCYGNMFNGCTSLTTAPELPATTLASNCYENMFYGCRSLTTAPELPATTLTEHCYTSMFSSCTSLTSVPELPATTLASYCYNGMFYGCASLTTAPALPVTTLAKGCYGGMFHGCTSLTTAPELPATTLASHCYNYMFADCRGLTTAPELPATTLTSNCYYGMFDGCRSLTSAPELPATTLVEYCYTYMFRSCTSLTSAPELPATTLASNCYNYMFAGCTGLTSAPELPATTLADFCYGNMFSGSTSINYIKCLATDISATNCTNYWVRDVSPTGTFETPSATNWETGISGIPEGWTRVDVN